MRSRLAVAVALALACALPAATGDGQSLQVPVTVTLREEAGRRFAAAELALAPLALADYLIELSIHRGQRVDRVIVPFRIVP